MITRHNCGENLPRHRHAEGYVAVVLGGGFVEAGDSGRWLARPGTVIVHGAHEAHRDAFDGSATAVLNLPLADGLVPGAGVIEDVDAVARLAERNPLEAAQLVATQFRSGTHRFADWPDLLAGALALDQSFGLADWADRMGLSPASVSRGFARVFGVSPKRYRLEARTRRAFGDVIGSSTPLAAIAATYGFADQAHMTRAFASLIGAAPGAVRAKSIQASRPPAH